MTVEQPDNLVKNVELAHQMANYEHIARLALINDVAREKRAKTIELGRLVSAVLYDAGEPSEETMRLRTIALFPEEATPAEATALQQLDEELASSQAAVVATYTYAEQRAWQAQGDYRMGVDRTAEIQQEDRTLFNMAEPE
jgi:hypothetical protein